MNWLVALALCGMMIGGSYAIWRRGYLDSLFSRVALVAVLLPGLLVLIVLKAWEVKLEGSPFSLTYGLCRRLGDVSWWGVILATVASGFALVGTWGLPIAVNPRLRLGWLVTAGVSVGIYLVLVATQRGTFFLIASWSSMSKWLQVVEGCMMVGWILIGHFFLIQLINALWFIQDLPPDRRGPVLKLPAAIYASIPAILISVVTIWPVFDGMCESCPGWLDPASGKRREHPDVLRVILQIIGLWWPLIVLLVVWLIGLTKASAPPEPVVPPTAPPKQ
ncbi:MAG: hypothetical protein L0Y58_17920 [Verrucomicrobia subdivision 3 bacterium]|nr:hypothetical protein [Limisphaerales bacterium]